MFDGLEGCWHCTWLDGAESPCRNGPVRIVAMENGQCKWTRIRSSFLVAPGIPPPYKRTLSRRKKIYAVSLLRRPRCILLVASSLHQTFFIPLKKCFLVLLNFFCILVDLIFVTLVTQKKS
jgi:hypothetical protein